MKKNPSISLLLAVLILVFSSCSKDEKIITSFGYMNEKLEEATAVVMVKNDVLKNQLKRKIEEDSLEYKPIYERLNKAEEVANDFYYYLESIKDSIYNGTLKEDQARSSYKNLTSSKYLDRYFFDGDQITPQGQEFLDRIQQYKTEYAKALGKGYGTIASMVTSRFRTKELMDYSGNIIPWLNFKFQSFPALASIFNITQMQSDVRQIETELINSMLSGEFKKEFAMRNYVGIVRLDKGMYYPDERITGKIYLGRYDDSAEPFDIVLNGEKLPDSRGVEGGVLIDFKAPEPGTHDLNGSFKVMYDGSPVRINFNSTYNVVSRDNVVEKVVYKTEYVEKPVYIDRPVYIEKEAKPKPKPKPKNVPKRAPDAKTRKYYSTGEKVSSDIEGTINTDKGRSSMTKTTLHQAKVGAIRTLDNKRFDVTSFMVKVPGQLTVYVEGNTFNDEAIRAIDKAKIGQDVTIFQIKAVDENGNRVGKVKEIKIKIIK